MTLRTRWIVSGLFAVSLVAAHARADLDLSELTVRVDAALADGALGTTARPHYESLRRTLAKRDRAGLADDFAKLDAVARKCAGPLAADAVLVASLAHAAAAGLDRALPTEDVEVASVATLVESGSARARVDRALRAARASVDVAATSLGGGSVSPACRSAGRAAAGYTKARGAAESAVRRQDRRPAKWRVVLDARAGALLSTVAGPGLAPDRYVVGANDGSGPTFLRGGGEGWVRIPTGTQGDLWWVAIVPGDGVWACGTSGQVVRYDPASGRVDDVSTGAPGTLYGLWGSGPSDVWTVGDGGPSRHAMLHWDGKAWTPVPTPPDADQREIYKVWGRAANDVWACGLRGLLLHWDGLAWTSVPTGTETTLLTVHGSGAQVVAVGQVDGATIVERAVAGAASGTFAPKPIPAATYSAAGVFVPPRGDAWAVGYVSTILRRTGSRWRLVTDVPGTDHRDLHGVFIDATNAVWIAGGDVRVSRGDGVLLQYGPRDPAGEVGQRASFRSRIQPLLASQCASVGCHDGSPAARFSTATANDSLRGLVGARTAESRLLRVLPGRPSESWLVHKIEDAPHGGARLQLDDLLAIRAWVLEGAIDSE
ncbi:MAG: hypothetical protein K8T90_21240 [Planctomycetes bacterium]|nr:hypothetical protein [Planctomycetota bacterium]